MLDEDEAELGDDGESGHAGPPPIQKFRGTAVGSVLAAGMLGLRDALEIPEDEEPAIVEAWGGQPVDDDMVLRLDPDNPQDSIVWVRPQFRRLP
jgi:hypothetical protein